jgi:hypothetical protein
VLPEGHPQGIDIQYKSHSCGKLREETVCVWKNKLYLKNTIFEYYCLFYWIWPPNMFCCVLSGSDLEVIALSTMLYFNYYQRNDRPCHKINTQYNGILCNHQELQLTIQFYFSWSIVVFQDIISFILCKRWLKECDCVVKGWSVELVGKHWSRR